MPAIFTHGSVSRQELLLYRAYNDNVLFGKLFLAGDFKKSETPAFHYEICKELNSKSTKPLAIIVARGHGKTTLIKAKVVKDFAFAKKANEWGFATEDEYLFYGWCAATQKKSIGNVKYVRMHFDRNKLLKRYFGNLSGRYVVGRTWGLENLELTNGCRLASWSNLSSMRGETEATIEKGGLRFSAVFLDDVENEENVKTDNSRENIASTIMDGILPAVDFHHGRLIFDGTPIHKKSFCQVTLDRYYQYLKAGKLNEYSWKVITYAATQTSMPGGVLWNSYIPREILDRKKQEYIDSPKGIDGYYQEYELLVRSPDDSHWKAEHIKYYSGFITVKNGIIFLVLETVSGVREVPVLTFGGCDPATDIVTRKSDYSVVMAIAVDANWNIYVLHYERHKNIPQISTRNESEEIIGKKGVVDYIFELNEVFYVKCCTVEDVALTRSVFNDFDAEKKRRKNYNLYLEPEKPAGREKLNKIFTGLNSYFISGKIHIVKGMDALEEEILYFGNSMGHDDTIESLYFAVKNAYPPMYEYNEVENEYEPRKRKAKGWKAS